MSIRFRQPIMLPNLLEPVFFFFGPYFVQIDFLYRTIDGNGPQISFYDSLSLPQKQWPPIYNRGPCHWCWRRFVSVFIAKQEFIAKCNKFCRDGSVGMVQAPNVWPKANAVKRKWIQNGWISQAIIEIRLENPSISWEVVRMSFERPLPPCWHPRTHTHTHTPTNKRPNFVKNQNSNHAMTHPFSEFINFILFVALDVGLGSWFANFLCAH